MLSDISEAEETDSCEALFNPRTNATTKSPRLLHATSHLGNLTFSSFGSSYRSIRDPGDIAGGPTTAPPEPHDIPTIPPYAESVEEFVVALVSLGQVPVIQQLRAPELAHQNVHLKVEGIAAGIDHAMCDVPTVSEFVTENSTPLAQPLQIPLQVHTAKTVHEEEFREPITQENDPVDEVVDVPIPSTYAEATNVGGMSFPLVYQSLRD